MAGHEEQVTPATPMPKGYKFLKKGNPFLTAQCRRRTIAEGKALYVVTDKSQTLGLRAPRWIINQVFEEEKKTRTKRKEAVSARDTAMEAAFEDATRRQFPDMPAKDTEAIIKQALKKRSGRVGRTGKLSIESKVRLAVAAHIRHRHTDYDQRIRQNGGDKGAARKAVHNNVVLMLKKWGGSHRTRTSAQRNTKKRQLKQSQTNKGRPSSGRSRQQRQKQKPKQSEERQRKQQTKKPVDDGAPTRNLRSSTTSTREEPILISSDTEDAMESAAESDDMGDLDTFSDVIILEDSTEEEDSDFDMEDVIDLD